MKTHHALGDFLSLAGFQQHGERWVPVSSAPIPPAVWSPTTGSRSEPAEDIPVCSAAASHHRQVVGLAGELTLRVPWISEPLFDCWLGPRLVWWSSGPGDRATVSVVSSRMSRAWDEQPEWFAGWRAIGRELQETGERLLLVTSTSTARCGRHVAERMRVPYVEVTVASHTLTVASWLRSLGAKVMAARSENPVSQSPSALRLQCELSPVLPPELTASLKWLLPESLRGADQSLPDRAIPVADRALVLLGHRLRTLSIRPGGQVESLLQTRELQREFWHGWTPPQALGSDEGHIPPATHPGKVVADCEHDPREQDSSKQEPRVTRSWLTIEHVASIPLLCHCTRRHDGPWEDQSEDEYWDELLWERPTKDRSALAVLSRILTTNRLAASSLAIRGGYRVIGFTARKLDELSAARVYQRHRRRWDFEPYGLAIHQAWLQQRGAQPVIYGDDRDWQRLDETKRPFFQPAGESSAATSVATDAAVRKAAATSPSAARWTREQEWRLVGDLDLRDLPGDAAFILVGDLSDVSRLPVNLRWPVVVLPSSGRLLHQ